MFLYTCSFRNVWDSPIYMSIDTMVIHEFKKNKRKMDKMEKIILAITLKWLFHEIFVTQLSFHMLCSTGSLKVKLT